MHIKFSWSISPTMAALIAVCSGYLIAPLGMTAVNVAIPAMADDLGADAIKVGWLPTLYLLSNVAFMLPVMKIADNYGRKKMYMAGLLLNALSAFMCAIATHIDWILIWRLIQGASAAMIFSTGVAIVTSVVPSSRRGSALGVVASCVYIGLTLAPAVGGYLTEYIDWRAVFYFQVPIVIGLVIFIHCTLKGEWRNPDKTGFDYTGTVLFGGFATCFVIGLSMLPDLLGLILTLLSLMLLITFIWHQSQSTAPLIRVQLFKENRVFSVSLATSFFMYGSNFALLFLLSLYLQYIKGYTPAFSGKILLLQAIMMAIVAPFAGKLSDRFQARVVASIGCVIALSGYIIMQQLDPTTDALVVSIALVLIGLGFGLFSTPNNNAIMSSIPASQVGVASASMNLGRTVGNLVGMSIVNLIIHFYLGNKLMSSQTSSELMASISMALTMSLVFVVCACILSIFRGRQTSY